MDWPETQHRLSNDKGKWSHIARTTGLHINAIRKIAIGETPTPRIDTVQKLIAYYGAVDAQSNEDSPARAA